MFTLTAKTHYGVRAVCELARHYGAGLLQIRDITDQNDIPKNYLEQIFNRLAKQGIVKSTRGNKGGYQLAESPSKITLLQVLESLEGEIEFSRHSEQDALRHIFALAERQLKDTLGLTFEQLLEQERSMSNQLTFDI